MKQMLLFFVLLLPFCTKAQLIESFNGVEISHNYPWQGDVDRFKVEGGFLRLFDRAQPADAGVYLYGATLTENEWTFRVKSDYRTTSKNYIRVYLWSNKGDLAEEHAAYYVAFGGEGGGNKQQISLCEKTEWGTAKKLIAKEVSSLNDTFDIHVHIVAKSEKITLYARPNTQSDYTEIGSSDYTPRSEPGYVILYCKYSTQHAQNKYFGPIRIKNFTATTAPENGNSNEKETALSLISLQQEDASTLLLSFNQPVNPEYASFVLTSLGEVNEIQWSHDEKQIRLIWKGRMEKGKSYTLTHSNLYDGNFNLYTTPLPPFIATFESESDKEPSPVIHQYKPGDILINEVMANPKGAAGLPETEYVELYNTTGTDIDLSGWSFYYATKATPLQSVIPAKGYAVLFREGRDMRVDHGGVSIPLASFPAALANTGKDLQLKFKDTLIDAIAYPKAKPGYSWERIGDNWAYSSDERGGTPGSANTTGDYSPVEEDDKQIIVLPREIIFSELLPEPQEGGSEYIELYNRSDRKLPLSDLAIAVRKADGSLNTQYPLNSITASLDAGEYAALTKNANGVLDFFFVPSPDRIHELKLPVLANTSSKLVLFRTKDKEVIDEVHYSEKWHSPSVKNKKGIALERINLDGDSQDPANWTSASSLAGGGTPGYTNSQNGTNTGEVPTGIHEPEFITTTGHYEIAYRLDRAGYICRASLYDTSGRKVAEIANQELIGTEGVFSWNGLATGGKRPATGVYILHAELHHPQGGRKTYKKVFLVR